MGVAAQCAGSKQEARLYYERAIELFHNLSNMYVVGFAAGLYREMADTARVRELYARWIPVLEQQLTSSPDNQRLRSVLVALLGLAGRKEEAVREAREVTRAMRRPRWGGESMSFVAYLALADAGEVAGAREALALLRTPDPATFWQVAGDRLCFGPMVLSSGAYRFPDTPEFSQFVRGVEARLAYLRQKY